MGTNGENNGGKDLNVKMSIENTELAYKRTQLAWVRTVFAIITTAIALDQLVKVIYDPKIKMGGIWIKNSNLIASLLTSVGSILLIIETIFYIRRTRKLVDLRDGTQKKFSGTAVLSVFVVVLGLLVTYMLIFIG
jgi:uncharacterized membrane protein YidH (DUF202 family)